jgi:hypothetical protein
MPLATVRPCPGVSDHLRTTTGVWVLYGYAQPSTSVAPIRAPWTRAPCAPGPPAGPVPPPPYVPAFPVRGEGWNMRGRSPKFWRTARPGSTSARDSRDRGVPGVSRLFGGKTAGHSVAGTAGTAGTGAGGGECLGKAVLCGCLRADGGRFQPLLHGCDEDGALAPPAIRALRAACGAPRSSRGQIGRGLRGGIVLRRLMRDTRPPGDLRQSKARIAADAVNG